MVSSKLRNDATMKFIEKETCHFMDKPCPHKIDEDELKELMEDPDTGRVYDIPVEDSQICMNCLLAQLIEALNCERQT